MKTYIVVKDRETHRYIICVGVPGNADTVVYEMSAMAFEHPADAFRALKSLQAVERLPRPIIEADAQDAAWLKDPKVRHGSSEELTAEEAWRWFNALPWAKVIVMPKGFYFSRKQLLD